MCCCGLLSRGRPTSPPADAGVWKGGLPCAVGGWAPSAIKKKKKHKKSQCDFRSGEGSPRQGRPGGARKSEPPGARGRETALPIEAARKRPTRGPPGAGRKGKAASPSALTNTPTVTNKIQTITKSYPILSYLILYYLILSYLI